MLNLSSTSDKVSVVLASAVATSIAASWVDRDASAVTTPGRLLLTPSTATTVDPVPAPAASTVRNVKHLSVSPTGGAQTVTVQTTDGSLTSRLIKVALAQDEVLLWTDGMGWQVLDATGQVKQLVTTPGRFLRPSVGVGTTWTAPADCTRVRIRLLGAGGGGAGAAFTATNASAGGGGGAGGYVEKFLTVVPGTVYTIAIGALGAGGTAGANNGSTGGNTTFNDGVTTYTASGGLGGVAQAAGTTAVASLGGAGGAATNGDVNAPGGRGESGMRVSGTAGVAGAGSPSVYGGGGAEAAVQGVGGAATGFGAGGGGALGLSATAAGGNGSAGLIYIDQYA